MIKAKNKVNKGPILLSAFALVTDIRAIPSTQNALANPIAGISIKTIKKITNRNIFTNFIWYKNAVWIEGGHPMVHGFFRLKDRKDRRPGFAIESRVKHYSRRTKEVRSVFKSWFALALEMEELWLQTRKRSESETRLRAEVERLRHELNRNLRAAELQLAHVRARLNCPELRVPSKLALAFRGLNFRMAKRLTYSRSDLHQFWSRIRQSKLTMILPDKVFRNFFKDLQLLVLFLIDLARIKEIGRQVT